MQQARSADKSRSAKPCPGCGLDVHAHVVPSSFPSARRSPAPAHWPAMAAHDACHATVTIDGRPYRTVSDACWVAERRIAAMDAADIAMQALSPMPELFSYWMEARPAADLVRYTNDVIGALVEEGRGRFIGLGGVPLQDLDLAVDELRRLVEVLGFAGVEIGSNVNGIAIGDARLEPFFAEAERLGAAVFVHAVRPTGMDRLVGPPPLQQVLAYPTDVGLAAASAITGNLAKKFPRLRIAFSHGGGTLAMLLPRLEQGYRRFPALRDALQAPPAEQARRFYFDSLVFDEPTLRHLIALFGETQVMIGTDYPFSFQEAAPVARIETAFDDPLLRNRLKWQNAATFLGLEEEP
ncbi:aminocarboxymuconate-semialdehyde decarboxylase [Pseudoxanthobacter soli DSM 19599]|uniref:2-amino-3-carboxymuconate-6-semialdehyde decarboxylase n=1 Tax=Pseudoxanthobacter soli DSM 19599 TaxID=1123029 RepID=A0A1M7Z9U8_9HYPH|nr:amidohydrolase family protein [Pseudoxanthobacter soli]SHO61664.1 aminocarboxymuconate-semialdehyde decarboxylase [Pseudoxanthobacter soli DSM 19599]